MRSGRTHGPRTRRQFGAPHMTGSGRARWWSGSQPQPGLSPVGKGHPGGVLCSIHQNHCPPGGIPEHQEALPPAQLDGMPHISRMRFLTLASSSEPRDHATDSTRDRPRQGERLLIGGEIG